MKTQGDTSVVVLIKGLERFVFLYNEATKDEMLKQLGKNCPIANRDDSPA
jgi:hypothetical protein